MLLFVAFMILSINVSGGNISLTEDVSANINACEDSGCRDEGCHLVIPNHKCNYAYGSCAGTVECEPSTDPGVD